jgi:hypothetical protein
VDNGDLEHRIRLIEDELAIKRLIDRYGRRADDFDWLGWSETLTEDSVFDFEGGFGLMRGRQQILEVCRDSMDPIYDDFIPYMLNILVDVDGSDIATGTGNIIFLALTDKDKPEQFLATGGRYRWEFRRTSIGWQIARTHLQFIWNNGADNDQVFTSQDHQLETSEQADD